MHEGRSVSLQLLVRTAAIVAALLPAVAAAQPGRLVGQVTDQTSGAPIAGAQVTLRDTRLGAVTPDNGRYLVAGVPAGTYVVEVRRVGFLPVTRANVVVPAAGEARVDLALSATAMKLDEVVVTGVTDPIAAEKVPFSVAKVTREDLPVPITTTSAILQAKVAGVTTVKGSGQPGSGSNVILRTPTSIQKGNGPLWVVDGVVLGTAFTGTTVDLDALDIESMEVVKGAAAASLYGSRAANGVISIRTVSGRGLATGGTQTTVRSEYGANQLAKRVDLNEHHWFALNSGGQFVDSRGNATTQSNLRAVAADRISDKAFPTPLYDNLGAFFDPGTFATNAVSIAQNSGRSNWFASFNRTTEGGVVSTLNGFHRNDFRLNLDNQVRDNLTASLRAYHSRSYSDDVSGSPFQDLIYTMPDVNLGARDEHGDYIPHPDPVNGIDNPIWRQGSRDNWTKRARNLASGDLSWAPLGWLKLNGNYSYDHSEFQTNTYVPKGVENADGSSSTGSITRNQRFTDAINSAVTASAGHDFGGLNTRLTLRGLMEQETSSVNEAAGTDLVVKDVNDLDVARTPDVTGSFSDVRATGYFTALGLDYRGRYTGDFLLRRDGSSLFGSRQKWHSYYRAAGAYRMAQEAWWPWKNTLDEFKLHFAIGSAGGRPSFADQYETFSVSSTGAVTKGTLGNPDLRPAYTVERETGLDVSIRNRVEASLVYAASTTSDQIIQVPAPATSGYTSQWVNAGTVRGRTVELTTRADVYRGHAVNWSMTLVADRSRSRILAWGRNCIFDDDGLGFWCPGVVRGDMYGYRFLRDAADLPAVHASSASQFQRNDDGYLVPVGPNGRWQDRKFGTSVVIDGVSYAWGLPITLKTAGGADSIVVIGTSAPRLHMGYGNNVRYKSIALYALLDWQLGNDVYNATKQRLYQYSRSGDVDQFGKADEAKKPIDYYLRLYNSNNNGSHFVEPGSFLKLRELSARYTPSTRLLHRARLDRLGAERVTLALIGRNLLTFSNYSGYDPEVGNAINRFDVTTNYPNFRTITGNLEIVF